jgi:protein-S-isoprenylcysteine O-methyltransferase Ste14
MSHRKLPPLVLAVVLISTGLFLVVPAWAWGDWRDFFAHPARVGAYLAVFAATVAMLFSGANLGPRPRVDRSLWLIAPMLAVAVAQVWLPPYADARGIWTLDGDATRYAGLALLVIGCVLRVGPMFALGERFRPPLADQEDHRLVTTGFYRWIRNPSYLGIFVGYAGWVLVFRCWIALIVLVLVVPMIRRYLPREEAKLWAEFGDEYDAYSARTWRFIPYVY